METQREIIVTSSCFDTENEWRFCSCGVWLHTLDGQTLQLKLKMRFLTFFIGKVSSSNIGRLYCRQAKAQFGQSKKTQSPYLSQISACFMCWFILWVWMSVWTQFMSITLIWIKLDGLAKTCTRTIFGTRNCAMNFI